MSERDERERLFDYQHPNRQLTGSNEKIAFGGISLGYMIARMGQLLCENNLLLMKFVVLVKRYSLAMTHVSFM